MNINLDFQGAVRKLFGGKTKQRSQLALVGTEDGRLVTVEYDVLRACAVDEKTEAAYLLDASNQVRSQEDGKWYQLLGERSTAPICLLNETSITNLKGLVEGIFRECRKAAQVKKSKEAKNNKNFNRFQWLVSMFVVAAIVLVFLNGGFS